ncbi:MAG: carbonic anhydrase [Sphingomonadaceae bacterium]
MPAFQALVEGYQRFRAGPWREQRLRYDALASGQAPRVMVIACSDSRVDPTRVFDAAPGEMFILRNIANLVPPMDQSLAQSSVGAALEYAVLGLRVEYIIVFGHARCGGIAASLSGAFRDGKAAGSSFLDRWMALISPVRNRVLEAVAASPDIDPQPVLERASIRQSLANLRSYPFVAEAESAGQTRLMGTMFDIADGRLLILNPESDIFEPVAVAPAA